MPVNIFLKTKKKKMFEATKFQTTQLYSEKKEFFAECFTSTGV